MAENYKEKKMSHTLWTNLGDNELVLNARRKQLGGAAAALARGGVGGLGRVFLACGVGEGRYLLLKGFFQGSIFRGPAVCSEDRGENRRDVHCTHNASLM